MLDKYYLYIYLYISVFVHYFFGIYARSCSLQTSLHLSLPTFLLYSHCLFALSLAIIYCLCIHTDRKSSIATPLRHTQFSKAVKIPQCLKVYSVKNESHSVLFLWDHVWQCNYLNLYSPYVCMCAPAGKLVSGCGADDSYCYPPCCAAVDLTRFTASADFVFYHVHKGSSDLVYLCYRWVE